MKVLHVDTGTEWRGGQQQVLLLTHGLTELGITSVVVTPSGSPLAKALRARNLPLIEIPYAAPYAPRTVRSLQRVLADRSWSVMHMHSSHAHTLGFLSLRLPPPRSFQRPAFVVSRRVDFVPHGDPLSRLKYTTPHQFFICVSDAIRTILQEYGIPPRSLYVVRSGVVVPNSITQEQRTGLRQDLGIAEDAFLIGNVGQLVPHKGHRYLLEAFAKLEPTIPRAHLILIGDGELEASAKNQAAQLGIAARVTFSGYRPGAARFIPAFDLYVHASVEEGLGTSILDAEAAGVPVVATRAGGIPEAVIENETACLVDPGDAGALAQCMSVLASDEARRQRMANAGPKWIRECRSERLMVEGTLAVYQDIVLK